MRDEELYKLLQGTDHRESDWAKSAEQFLKLKIASGGLTQHQMDTLRKKVKVAHRFQEIVKTAGLAEMPVDVGAAVGLDPEAADTAVQKGMLSGIRGGVSGDMARAYGIDRTRGENVGKLLGALGGATGGYFAGRSIPGLSPAIGMAAGGLGGHMLGKNVGRTIDEHRMRDRFEPHAEPKEAELEKQTEKDSEFDKEGQSAETLGKLLKSSPSSGAMNEGSAGLLKIIQAARLAASKKVKSSCMESKMASVRGKLKIARIFGAHVPSHVIESPVVPYEHRRGAYEGYLKEKGLESPTSLPAALAGGGITGALLGALAGGASGRGVGGAGLGALVGGGLGVGAGALARHADKQEIARAQQALAEGGNIDQDMASRIGDIAQGRDMTAERRHQQMLGAISGHGGYKYGSAAAIRQRMREKLAAEDQGLTIQPPPADAAPGAAPSGMGGEGQPDVAQLEEFLQAQQEANEAEFFRQRADEAAAQAAQLQEHAEMLQQQNQQLQQQAQQTQQEGQQQAEMAAQQAQQAQAESQMAQQDAVQARDESLNAQQQNIALRQAITQYRQQLMDLLAQDPTMVAGPPQVPQGPMPGGPPPGPEAGGPPGAEGAPPGAEGGPPEAAGAPPGAEGPPPGAEGGGAPPEAAGGPPMAPPAAPPAPPAGGGQGVTVNVKPSQPAKAKKPAA